MSTGRAYRFPMNASWGVRLIFRAGASVVGSQRFRRNWFGHEAVLDGEKARAGTIRDADLPVDVFDVVPRRLPGDYELFRNLLVGQSTDQEL